MKEGIQIKVLEHQAKITHLLGKLTVEGEEEFVAIVDFGEKNPWGLILTGVNIPAKLYSREEFIEKVTKEAEKVVMKHLEDRAKEKESQDKRERLRAFAKTVTQVVGLEAK